MAERIHLFPFRTQKLSFLTPKVLALKRREDRSSPLSKEKPQRFVAVISFPAASWRHFPKKATVTKVMVVFLQHAEFATL